VGSAALRYFSARHICRLSGEVHRRFSSHWNLKGFGWRIGRAFGLRRRGRGLWPGTCGLHYRYPTDECRFCGADWMALSRGNADASAYRGLHRRGARGHQHWLSLAKTIVPAVRQVRRRDHW
jgi:hypothetical protein